jgi:Ca-activated chloride channel family protein
LSNLVELESPGTTLPRVLAHHLEQLGRLDQAVETLELLLREFPKDQQIKRDLALVLAKRAESCFEASKKKNRDPEATRGLADQSKADYTRSLELLYDVVVDDEGANQNLGLISLMDANRFIRRADELGVAIPQDPRLLRPLQCGLRIVMTILSDNADVVLHVTEPSGETADRNHNRTMTGGYMSPDSPTDVDRTQEYFVRKVMRGKYGIEAHVIATREDQDLVGIVARLDIFADFGRRNEKVWTTIRRLKKKEGPVSLGHLQLSPHSRRYLEE